MGKSALHVSELGNAKLVEIAMATLAAVQHLSMVEIASSLKKGGMNESTFKDVLQGNVRAPERPAWRGVHSPARRAELKPE